jgi:hypothetical protein
MTEPTISIRGCAGGQGWSPGALQCLTGMRRDLTPVGLVCRPARLYRRQLRRTGGPMEGGQRRRRHAPAERLRPPHGRGAPVFPGEPPPCDDAPHRRPADAEPPWRIQRQTPRARRLTDCLGALVHLFPPLEPLWVNRRRPCKRRWDTPQSRRHETPISHVSLDLEMRAAAKPNEALSLAGP